MAIDTISPNVPGLDVPSPNPGADHFLAERGIIDPAAANKLGPAADKWAETRSITNSLTSIAQPIPQSMKITTQGDRLFVGGKAYRGVYVNASDLFFDYLKGGTAYIADLATLASKGVKLIRCTAGPYVGADWTTYVGTNATAPVAGYLTKLRTFLDEAGRNGIGVELVLFWNHTTLPTVLSETVTAYQNPASATRAYIRAFARNMAINFAHHPALAAWQVGNEYFNYVGIAKFATATADTAVDHIKYCADVHSETVTAIREFDADRAVFSAGGGGGVYEGHSPHFWIKKLIATAGTCDVIAYHPYAHTWRAGFPQFATGYDYGGLDILLPLLRQACRKAGKVLVIEECGADDDSGSYGTPVGRRAAACYAKSHAAGVELVGDWGWYANDPTSLPNLKTTRSAVMDIIQARNASVPQGYIAPAMPYIQGTATSPFPKLCARGSGSSNGYLRIPNDPSIQPSGSANEAYWLMFWMRKRAVLATTTRIMASNDGTGGMVIAPTSDEGFSFALSFTAGGLATYTPSAFTYPADQGVEPNQTAAYPWQWQHVAIQWDATVRNEAWNDGKQHIDIWIDGVYRVVASPSSARTYAPTTRNMHFLSGSDGLSGYAAADVADIITGQSYLTCEAVKDYMMKGTVPASANHRWKLDGNVNDSIGSLNAVAGAGLNFVASGL